MFGCPIIQDNRTLRSPDVCAVALFVAVAALMHTPRMPSVLSHCRTAMTRNRGLRVFWLLALVGLLFSGVPRWEVHRHTLADHDHAHHVTADAHDAVTPDASDAPSDLSDESTLHFHALLSPVLALADLALPAVEGLAPSTPVFSDASAFAPAQRWPPPHRPPIA